MTERIAALDALRGFALVGIILGNATWFSGYAVASSAQRAALGTATLDEPVAFLLHVLVDGKFYGLFSLMFGASFVLMVDRAEARGLPVASVVRRRLAALFAIGGLHATLVWFGDIISLYAVSAVPLYWMRGWSIRRLAVAATVCLTAPVVIGAIMLAVHVVAGDPGHSDGGHGPAALLPAFARGGHAEVLSANWVFLCERWELELLSSRPLRLLGMFVLGMLAVRLRRSPSYRGVPALVLTALVGNVALALLADVPTRPPSLLGLVRDVIYAIAIPAGSLAYAAILWPRFSSRGAITSALAAAGRLSLSHYLTQSLVSSAIFYGLGYGLWGRVGIAWASGIALAIVVLQVCCSRPWLWHRDSGPAERVLRRLTYCGPRDRP